jgi:hypothetical protein
LAERAGVNHHNVARLELGGSARIPPVRMLAEGLGVDARRVMQEELMAAT